MSSRGSGTDYYEAIARLAAQMFPPLPPLRKIRPDMTIAVAATPGKILEEWQHAALGVWIARTDAVGAEVHAEQMTARQLRSLLAARGETQ